MPKKREKDFYEDFGPVEVQREYHSAQELPEGPYGEPRKAEGPLDAGPERENTRAYSNFNYENKELHADTPRKMFGSHPVHSEGEDNVKENVSVERNKKP